MAKGKKDIDEAFRNDCVAALTYRLRDINRKATNPSWDEIVSECRYMSVVLLIIALSVVGLVTTIQWAYGCAVDSARDFVKAEFRVRECMTQKDWAGRAQSEDDCRYRWTLN